MSRSVWRPACLLALSLMGTLARPVTADPVASYLIRGPGAAVFWGPGQDFADTEVVVFAFSEMAPVQGDQPPPGPRVIFSVTRLIAVGDTVIRRQWFGEAPLKAKALVVAPGLAEAKLQANITGTLEERRSTGSVTRRQVTGTVTIRWVATSGPATTSLAINSQAVPVAVQLNAVGEGRSGQATVHVKVNGLGATIQKVGPGTLLAPSAGTLTLSFQ